MSAALVLRATDPVLCLTVQESLLEPLTDEHGSIWDIVWYPIENPDLGHP